MIAGHGIEGPGPAQGGLGRLVVAQGSLRQVHAEPGGGQVGCELSSPAVEVPGRLEIPIPVGVRGVFEKLLDVRRDRGGGRAERGVPLGDEGGALLGPAGSQASRSHEGQSEDPTPRRPMPAAGPRTVGPKPVSRAGSRRRIVMSVSRGHATALVGWGRGQPRVGGGLLHVDQDTHDRACLPNPPAAAYARCPDPDDPGGGGW